MSPDLLPLQQIVFRGSVLQVANLRQVETPQVIESTLSNITPSKDKHLVLVNEGGMVTATLRLRSRRPQLIPVTLLKGFAIGFHGSHVETFGHIDRLLLFDRG